MVQFVRMLAICLAFALQVQGIHFKEDNKTSIDWFLSQDKPKVFFIAALEGSGTAVFQKLWKNSFDITKDEVQHVVKFPEDWMCGTDWRFAGFDIVVDRLRKVKQNDIKALPFQATYPSCGAHGHDHVDREYNYHPDLEWIRKAADMAGVALHIIFVDRNPEDCLKLTCKNRNYENCTSQTETLYKNADYLMKQIRAIDKNLVSCFDYSSDKSVRDMVHKQFGKLPVIEDEFKSRDISNIGNFADESRKRNNTKFGNFQRAKMDKLEKRANSLSDVCHSMPQFTIEKLKEFIAKGHGDTTRLAAKLKA